MKKAAPAPPANDTVELEVSDTALCRLLSSITSAHSDPPMTALYVKEKKKKKKNTKTYINLIFIRYTRVHHVPQAEHVENSIG